MKTLENIKQDLAKSFGMTWEQVIQDSSIINSVVDAVAKKHAIEFAEWVCDEYEIIYINDEIKYKSQSDDEHEGFPFFTMEQLYQRFKEENK